MACSGLLEEGDGRELEPVEEEEVQAGPVEEEDELEEELGESGPTPWQEASASAAPISVIHLRERFIDITYLY